AAGGTLGAIAGPALAVGLAGPDGPLNLLPVSAVLLGAAVVCVWRLGGRAAPRNAAAGTDGEALGGGVWAGIVDVVRSPYLIGICFYLFCYTVISTLLYVEVVRLVPTEYPDSAQRTRLFATLDLVVNVLTLALQFFATARVFERLGVTVTLTLLPAVSV